MPAVTFDAHCHLQDPRCGDVDAVLARARIAGVERLVCCGTRESDWEAVLALARRHRSLIPMLGLHPWELPGASPEWPARLEASLSENRAGVGECGLDFARPGADRAAQEAALRFQLRLAKASNRPLALHCVRAWGPLIALLREEGLPAAGAMVHAYGGSAETARALQGLGVFISFSASLASPRRAKLREALLAVDDARLLLESDAPDQPFPGEEGPREPAELLRLLAFAAERRGTSPEALARQTRANALKLFAEVAP